MSDDLSIPSPAAYRPPHRSRGLSPDTRRRMMIAGGILGVVIVVGGTISLVGRSTDQVPVIQADPRPVRIKPENPGGMRIAGLNNEIYGDGDTTDGARLAPAAEVPDPTRLRALPPEPRSVARASAGTSAGPSRAAPVSADPTSDPARSTAVAPVATPAAQSNTDPDQAGTAPAIGTAKPAAAGTAGQRAVAALPTGPAGVPDKRPVSTPATAPSVSTQAASTQAASTQAGRVAVQLAAVRSAGAAQAEWTSLQRRLPDLLGGRQAVFPRAERDGKTFYRVRTAGFSDIAEARGFCQRVRAKGAACAVAAF